MVNFCAVVGCGNRSDREKEISFYRLPAVIFHQGEKTRELSQKRRDVWLTRIHREDLGREKYPYTRVCSLHFISGNLSTLASYLLAGICMKTKTNCNQYFTYQILA